MAGLPTLDVPQKASCQPFPGRVLPLRNSIGTVRLPALIGEAVRPASGGERWNSRVGFCFSHVKYPNRPRAGGSVQILFAGNAALFRFSSCAFLRGDEWRRGRRFIRMLWSVPLTFEQCAASVRSPLPYLVHGIASDEFGPFDGPRIGAGCCTGTILEGVTCSPGTPIHSMVLHVRWCALRRPAC